LPTDPTAVELKLMDTGETVTLTKDKPFLRVDGYMADLFYPPANRKWTGRRVGDVIPIEKETYNIVAITKDEVVLSARSGKKTSLKYKPGLTESSNAQRSN